MHDRKILITQLTNNCNAWTSSVKLAIANVATQDAYNRPGNLVFCDLEGGFCKHMAGHESFEENEFACECL